MEYPSISPDDLPWLTVEQMAEADRLAIEEYSITLLQMMEHAGSSLAELVAGKTDDEEIVVLAGGGNNGGGGLCAARHLANRGRRVSVIVSSDRMGEAPRRHLGTLSAMGIAPQDRPGEAPVVIDAMVGYGLGGPLRGRAAQLAAWSRGRTVFSLDLPSGHGHAEAVVPTAILTLALPKEATRDLRPLYLADLGLPAALWSRLGLHVGPIFSASRILEIS
jgi:NAD(P)H-hydrate epimerase